MVRAERRGDNWALSAEGPLTEYGWAGEPSQAAWDIADWILVLGIARPFIPFPGWTPEQSASERRKQLANEIQFLVPSTSNYAAKPAYEASAFEKAFAFFASRHYGGKSYRVLCPILGLQVGGTVSLDANLDALSEEGMIRAITLAPLSETDFSAIATFGERAFRSRDNLLLENPQSSVTVDIESPVRGPLENEATRRFVTAARFFDPEGRDLARGPMFEVFEGWIQHRHGIPDVGSVSSQIAIPYVWPPAARWSNGEPKEFQGFWQRHCNHFGSRTPKGLSLAFDRFDQSFLRHDQESRLIDYAIILESTILKDVAQTESYRHRLALRAAHVLNHFIGSEKREVFEFFQNFYDVRSGLVHKDVRLSAIAKEVKGLDARTYVRKVRCLLAAILTHYLDQAPNAIEAVNKRIDDAALAGEYRP